MPIPQVVTIRDPLWDTIRLDPVAVRIMDSAAFQRLRYIRQLGLAYMVYPGATHTRFDHALGVYHLATRALGVLKEQGMLEAVAPEDCQLAPLAALLHDVGHYPFSHAVEELEAGWIPGHHEAVVGRFLDDPAIRAALEEVAPDGPARVEALIRGESESPLQGLVSGSLDLDKIEYLKRDARFCGVPYGEVDVDRLLYALVVVEDPATGRLEVGVREKGVAALESLLFAKYQMFRNVYWHHAVRSATVMYKRIVVDALAGRLLSPEELIGQTDESLLFLLEARARAGGVGAGAEAGGAAGAGAVGAVGAAAVGGAVAMDEPDPGIAARVGRWIEGLRSRRLPKRAAEIVAAELDGEGVGEWIVVDSVLKREVEDRLAAELGVEVGGVFLDYPAKPLMFGLDLLALRSGGEVQRLGPGGQAGLIGLPGIADELYRSARVLRLFVLDGGHRPERLLVERGALIALATLSEPALRRRLEDPAPLLGG